MSSHPDADAFMRGYLRQPTDVTARLVFADWLEETGRSWNRAWAYYIRLKAEADRHEFRSPGRNELEAQAAGYVPNVRARLTIPARLFVGYPRSLLQLLPAPNITVRLADFEIPLSVVELMPESVARENVVMPLDLQGSVLLVVTADPHLGELVERCEFILNKHIVAVRGEVDDIAAAINRHYGNAETESVTSVHYDMPVFTLSWAPDYRLASLLVAAFDSEAKGFELRRDGETAELRLIQPRRAVWGPTSFPAAVLDDLAHALLALHHTSEHRFPDRLTRDVEARTVGNRIQRYAVEIETSAPCSAVTLRFNWR